MASLPLAAYFMLNMINELHTLDAYIIRKALSMEEILDANISSDSNTSGAGVSFQCISLISDKEVIKSELHVGKVTPGRKVGVVRK